MELTLGEILKATKGELLGESKEITINGVSTDTRTIQGGMLFIPLKGESFDGHKFISTAVEKGASLILTEVKDSYEVPAILVDSTHDAMGRLAGYYVEKLGIPVVAVTGSVGKTTTKDMLASVLSQKFNVYKTQGNLNNDIGVPLTIFSLTKEHSLAVIEMGMNHFKEISYLTNIARPDIAVITNVGVSHIENLGSREGILKAKCEIFEGLKAGGTAVVNGDDDMLVTLRDSFEKENCTLKLFGTSEGCSPYGDNIREMGLKGIAFTLHIGERAVEVTVPIPGKHMVLNALSAAAVGDSLGMTIEEIKAGIESFEPTKMRMDIISCNGLTIINDAYNSNPVSAKAGVDVLASAEGEKIAILGDMFELGDYGPELHRDLGEYTAGKAIDKIICVGALSLNMYEGAKAVKAEGVYHYPTQEELLKDIATLVTGRATVLVKASRGMHLEHTVEKLKGE